MAGNKPISEKEATVVTDEVNSQQNLRTCEIEEVRRYYTHSTLRSPPSAGAPENPVVLIVLFFSIFHFS